MKRVIVAGVFLFLALPLLPGEASEADELACLATMESAEMVWKESEQFAELGAIAVLIEPLEGDVEDVGLTESQLKTDVELRLRKAGVRVVEEEGDQPTLYVQLAALAISAEAYTYGIYVSLRQLAITHCSPEPRVSVVTTWSEGGIGTATAYNVAKVIRDDVGDQVDEFLNLYLAANPK